MSANKSLNTIPSFFAKCLKVYIPEDLHKYINFGEDVITVGERINEIYGSTESLIEDLKEFYASARLQIFCTELAEPIDIEYPEYTSLKKNKFISEQGLLTRLQSTIPRDLFDAEENHLILSLIGYYIRTKESNLDAFYQLVTYHEELFKELSMKIRQVEIPTSKMCIDKQKAFKKLKKFLPANKEDKGFSSVLKALEKYEKRSTVEEKPYHQMLFFVQQIIPIFERFVENYPKQPTNTPIVRLFQNEKEKYVFAHELLQQMKLAGIMDFSRVYDILLDRSQLQTIVSKELGPRLGSLFGRFEFVITPIRRTSKRALYVPTSNGDHCILQSDFLLEFLREAVTVKSVFPCVNQDNLKALLTICLGLRQSFAYLLTSSRFLSTADVANLRKIYMSEISEFVKKSRKTIKAVRKVGPNGFTLDDLKKEMQYLEIDTIYPDALKDCEEHYNRLCTSKAPEDLTTCDMYFILEKVQVFNVVARLPEMAEFFHSVDACEHVFLNCKYCCSSNTTVKTTVVAEKVVQQEPASSVSKEATSDETSSESNAENTHSSNKSMEKSIKTESKPEEVIKGEDQLEEAAEEGPTSSVSEDVPPIPSSEQALAEKRKEKKKRQAEKKKMEKEQVIIPEKAPENDNSPENRCEKCFRTSQHCEKAKMQFNEEKIKNKALRKDLAEMKKEKDAEIQELKEKLAALEALMQKATSTKSCQTSSDDSSEVTTLPRILSPSYKYSELSPDVRNELDELRNIRASIPTLTKNATDKAKRLMNKTKDSAYQSMSRLEQKRVLEEFDAYSEIVGKNIELIRSTKSLDNLPPLPDHPTFSRHFEEIYEKIVNKELLDRECLVCAEIMVDLEETIKCKNCYRRHHRVCVWNMIEKGRDSCTVCPEKLDFDQ